MTIAYYSVLTIIIIFAAVLAYVQSSKQKNLNNIDLNQKFNSEVEYLKFIENHPNQFVLISSTTRKILYENEYKLIQKFDKNIVNVNIDDLSNKIPFTDIINLVANGIKIQAYYQFSKRFKLALKIINKDDIVTLLSSRSYDSLLSDSNSKKLIEDKDLSNEHVVIDQRLYTDIASLITQDTKYLKIISGELTKQITFNDNLDTLVLDSVKLTSLANTSAEYLELHNMKLSSVNYDYKDIKIVNCVIDNYDFNNTSSYELSNIEVINIEEFDKYHNVHLKDIIKNEFKLLSIGTMVTIDERKYNIVGYYKMYDNAFYYYKGRSVIGNEIIYFNPLSIGNEQQESVKSNLDILKYYNQFLPKRNRADTYNKRIIENDFTYKLNNYDEACAKYLKFLNLIDEDIEGEKIEESHLSSVAIENCYLNIEYQFLKDMLSKGLDIDQLVLFYENIFSANLIESRISFLTLNFITELYYTSYKLSIYEGSSELTSKVSYLIDLYENKKQI